MGEEHTIRRYTYNTTTLVVVGSGKYSEIYVKTNLQTIKLTWFDPAEPQRILMSEIAENICSGEIKTVPELFSACAGKIVGVGVSNWYKHITG